MQGLMMDRALVIPAIIDHAAQYHGDTEVVSVNTLGGQHRTNYAQIRARALRMASALEKRGMRKSDRIATIAWNNYRHLELYYAISGSGYVLHTINPRLFAEQLVYIINHAEDRILFFDAHLPAAGRAAARAPAAGRALRADGSAGRGDRTEISLAHLLRGPAGRGRRTATDGPPRWTSATPPRCATPPAPPAIPRACSIRTAPRCCTP